jgi:hypothetical protein
LRNAHRRFDAWTPRLEGQYCAKLSLQYTGQRAVGGGPLSDLPENQPLASNVGARVTLSNDLSILNLAYSATGHWGAIISPWGSNPSYTVCAIGGSDTTTEWRAIVYAEASLL